MASADKELQYIVLDDFSPGIFDDNYANTGSRPAPNGAAQQTNTYGCIAGQQNSLEPGPTLVNSLFQTLFDTPMDAAHYPDQQIRLLHAKVMSPVYITGAGITTINDIIFMIHEYFFDPGGTSSFANARLNVVSQVYTRSGGSVYTIAKTTEVGPHLITAPVYGPASLDFSRANTGAPTTVGHPCVAIVAYNFGDATATGSQIKVYPANATPGANSSDDLIAAFSGVLPEWIFAHQDRFLALSGGANEVHMGIGNLSAETVQFTDVNNYNNVSPKVVFVAENPSGFGSFSTQNASTALFIKRNSGGYMISGALESPTITRFPGIPGADPPNLPARINDGTIVYGNRQGLWQWSGGDMANCISSQLQPSFWVNPNYDPTTWHVYPSLAGQFSFSYPFMYVSNNWLYDVRNGGWWKLNIFSNSQSIPTYHQFDVSADGLMICFPYSWGQPGGSTSVADYWDIDTPALSYSWQSQPLKESVNRELAFRELDVTAQAQGAGGSLIFTFTDLLGNLITTTPTITVTATNRPYTQSIPIAVDAHDVIMRVQSQGSLGWPAPRIVRIGLGYKEQETAR